MSKIPETRTRRDLIHQVSERSGASRSQCKKWVNTVLTCLGDMLLEADPELRIELRNHGVYSVKRTSGRLAARNPRTGESVEIPVRRKVYFKPSKRIKRAMDQPLESTGDE